MADQRNIGTFCLARRRRLAGVASLAIAAIALLAVTSPPTAPAKGEMGFVLTEFAPAIYQDKGDCPDGLANTVKENYLQLLSPDERKRLSAAASEPELTARWKAYAMGPNNANICANVELFSRPVQKMYQGKVARGLNLDGADGNGSMAQDSCAHDNFTAPDGEKGIDNQVYRALGCTRNYRGVDGVAGDVVKGLNSYLATGEHTMVLLLRGVDSLTNDDDVEVILASTDDRPVLDARRNFIAGASFTVSDNPQVRNDLHGRIVNEVLITEPAEVRLTRRVGHGGIRGAKSQWDFQRGRFRLVIRPDGTLKGLFGGYQTPRNIMAMSLLGGIGAAETAGIDCAAEYATLQKVADGIRDPKTGQCTAVSAALDVAAIPAFVIDRAPIGKVAAK